jgi:hypothetical protein
MEKKIFVSVGKTSTPEQEAFVSAIEDRLRGEGLIPHTVGRNTFTAGAPLKKVLQLISECSGAVVIALERTYFPAGTERRGNPSAADLQNVRLPTAWNQIEAAMAYCNERPLLVIVEDGLRDEGLLEKGNDWYVQRVTPNHSALSTIEFNGVLASWKEEVLARDAQPAERPSTPDASQMTLLQLVGSLKPAQLWSLLGALALLVGGAFSLGAKLFGRG